MPCNTVQTSTVMLKAADRDLLALALADLGATDIRKDERGLHFTLRGKGISGVVDADGRCTTTSSYGRTLDANDINRAYSHRVIQTQAKKYGWSLKQNGDKYVVTKR
jgi:hypothetical protein